MTLAGTMSGRELSQSTSAGPEVFFSFYAAHGQQFKVLEIYNPKPVDVDMSNYKLLEVGLGGGGGCARRFGHSP